MIDKKIIIFYNDISDHVARAEGILIKFENDLYYLDNGHCISKNKIIRIEVKENG